MKLSAVDYWVILGLSMQYWLMKSEPDVYGITDLERDRITLWDGVRNYQARNYLKSMEIGDLAFFYHSNAKPPGIVGVMKIVEARVVDPTQFDPNSDYYDAKSLTDAPRWYTVRAAFVREFSIISLDTLRQTFTPEELGVVRQGNRLSVLPVQKEIFDRISKLIS
ncbi:MAG: EVE domain-containing protein [Leptolyngbya sp. Prado105]|jgi:predicted RNA-binding protein with PUA-like domain|nr:EVE domain-containing protein [Leptolyngbya sp. Prado105]